MRSSLSTFLLLVLSAVGQLDAQTSVPQCPKPKHSDMFGFRGQAMNWPVDEIRELRESTVKQPGNPSLWIGPVVVNQLYSYHSACSERSDTTRFNELIALYAATNALDPDRFAAATVDGQIALVGEHLDRLVNDDAILPKLIYTMDDGPLYGTVVERFPKADKTTAVPVKFGSLKIAEHDSKIYVGAFTKEGKRLWARTLQGAHSERDLRSYSPDKVGIEEFEAVSILTTYVDGERLRLFVRPDGRFAFYMHSW